MAASKFQVEASMSPRMAATVEFCRVLAGSFDRVRRGPAINWARADFAQWPRQAAVFLDEYFPFRGRVGNPAVISIETAMRFDPETDQDLGPNTDWLWDRLIEAVLDVARGVNQHTGLPFLLKTEVSNAKASEWSDAGLGIFGVIISLPVDI